MESRDSAMLVLPDEVVDLIASIARNFGGERAIDPWCHDARVLDHFDFASMRVGLVPHIPLYSELSKDSASQLRPVNVFEAENPGRFDVVYWGPSWGMKVDWQGRQHRVEAFALDLAAKLLAEDGVALCLLPPNVLVAQLWSGIRHRIASQCALEMTVEFPRDTFPGISFQPVLIVFRNAPPKEQVFLAEYQGRPRQLLQDLKEGTGRHHVAAHRLLDRWDRNFHDPRFEVIGEKLQGFPSSRLGELAEIFLGIRPAPESISDDGDYLLVSGEAINRGYLATGGGRYMSATDDEGFRRATLVPGDIVVSLIQPRIHVVQDHDPPAVAGHTVSVIRPNQRGYLEAYLQTEDGRWLFDSQVDQLASRLGTVRRMGIRELAEIQIPIVPLSRPDLLHSGSLQKAGRSELLQLSGELLSARREILILRHRLEQEEGRAADARQQAADSAKQLSALEITRQFLETQFSSVNERLTQVQSSLSELRGVVDEAVGELRSIKASPRNTDEKLVQMRISIDRMTVAMEGSPQDLAAYSEMIETWLSNRDRLHARSLQLLVSAEHLFDILSKGEAPDYSPFALQYCRSLENDLLVKVFESFHDDFNSRVADRAAFVANDLRNDKLSTFAKSIKNDNRRHSMGSMLWYLNLARPDGATLAQSPLVQDFARFTANHFGKELTSAEFTSALEGLTTYRNLAAHPHLMALDVATECRDKVREILVSFLNMQIVRPGSRNR